jgi:hypothetical protein
MPIIPFLTTPSLLGNPSLTCLEIPPLCHGANSRPLWSQVGCILNAPHPPHSPFPLPTVPTCSNACPLKTTLRYRLHTVRYNDLTRPAQVRYVSDLEVLTLIWITIKMCAAVQLGIIYDSQATSRKQGGLPVRAPFPPPHSYWLPGSLK